MKALRSFIAIISARHLLIAGLLIVDAPRYRAAYSFRFLFAGPFTPAVWAVLLTILGAAAAVAAKQPPHPARIRWVLACSAGTSAAWAAAIIAARVADDQASLLLAVLFGVLTLKDLAISAYPWATIGEIVTYSAHRRERRVSAHRVR